MKKIKIVFSSLRFQLIAVFFFFTVLITIVMECVCLYYFRGSLKEEAIDYSIQSSNQISMEAQILLDEATKILQWGRSNNAYKFLNAGQDRHEEVLQLITDMNMYRMSALIDSSIENVYLFDVNGIAYNEKVGVYEKRRYPKSEYIYETIQENQDFLVYVKGDQIAEDEPDFILYGTAVPQHATDKTIGYIVVEFKGNLFENMIVDKHLGETGNFCMIDQNFNVIAGEDIAFKRILKDLSNPFEEESGHQILRYDGNEILTVYNSIPHTQWYLIGSVYLSEMMKGINRVIVILSISALISVVLSLCAYILVATKMTRPIWQMKEKMLEAAGGNLDAVIEEYSHNEFVILETQYNKMLLDIKELIEANTKDQQALQKAELNALQAQIAPHFLYNTLDTIIWLVAVQENDKAIEMIENLSIFFKTTLSKGMNWIPVEREIDHVRSYLYIQQSRYNDILTYSIDVEEKMLSYEMLKMTLQPIVENAIYHGIKNKVGGGHISISGKYKDDQSLVFEIVDTGVGMETEEVYELNRKMQENVQPYEDKENGFGLYNVNRRIRLYYGDEYGITVESRKEEGTSVKIYLGAVRRNVKDV